MQTLVASSEVFSDHIEWEPLLRHITIGEDAGQDQVRWTVHGSDGQLRDYSPNWDSSDSMVPTWGANGWLLIAARIQAGVFEPNFLNGWAFPTKGSFADPFPEGQRPGEATLPMDRTFKDSSMIIIAGIADSPNKTLLALMAFWLIAISITVWLIAAFAGHWICRKALAPVTLMANSARALSGHPHSSTQLPVPATEDELEDLGKAFNQLIGELREAFERQARFTGDASHQLRTPLTAMMTMVEVGLRQDRSPDEYKKILISLALRCKQLRDITDGLLFLARAGSDSELPKLNDFNLIQWLSSWMDSWKEHHRFCDIKYKSLVEVAFVRSNDLLLTQVIDNILENAFKYSDKGTSIYIEVFSDLNNATIRVSDSGCGIPGDDLEKIFEPFYRTKVSRKLGITGIGLGLTLARRLMQWISGELVAFHRSSGGSSFEIRIPLVSSKFQ